MPADRIDTVVIGGGQAGLCMSHSLAQRNVTHVVLERARVAERWRTERWDSLRFQFPNWSMRLPGFAYSGDDPDGFAPRDDVVRFIEAFAAHIAAPVRTGVNVRALRRSGDDFALDTSDGVIEARNVVIATGPYHRPAIPPVASGLGDVLQIGASAYQNPAQLPAGGVLVVGAGASGVQIAEELLAGRPVFLAVGPHRRVPRRYRGRDFIWWINALGHDEAIVTPEAAARPPLLLSGAYGGRTVDLRQFARQGMVLLGRLSGAQDGVARFADDLMANLRAGDESLTAFLHTADAHGDRIGLPREDHPMVAQSPLPAPIRTLDLGASGVASVIWATGYRYDFDWVHLDVFADGAPIQRRGVTPVPGCYFLGLSLMYKTKSSFLSGVGEDAEFLAERIADR